MGYHSHALHMAGLDGIVEETARVTSRSGWTMPVKPQAIFSRGKDAPTSPFVEREDVRKGPQSDSHKHE